MKKAINDFTTAVQDELCRLLTTPNEMEKILPIAIAAFNAYSEDVMDGANYIFDINNHDDFLCLVKGGMTAEETSGIYQAQATETPYLQTDGCLLLQFENNAHVAAYLCSWINDVVCEMICKPDLYKDLYETIISCNAI